ncbi:MAG: hypothetical protein KGV50_06695 [Gammaproteobacteria bacterium]|nr:hypothetical protein [Gammaproteobacteria bacterium]
MSNSNQTQTLPKNTAKVLQQIQENLNKLQLNQAEQQADNAGKHSINTNHLPAPHNPNRKVIDVSDVDTNEVIVISSIDIADIQSCLEEVITTFEDLANLFYILEQGKINNVGSIARVAQQATACISNLAFDHLAVVNNALKDSKFNFSKGAF